MRKRIVLDTNILVSALGWQGSEREIIARAIDGEYALITSKDLLAEFNGVINRNKFSFIERSDIRRFMVLIVEIFDLVDTTSKIDVIREDPDDNIVLECAVDGNADIIVSGDVHLLDLKEYRSIRILRPGDLLRNGEKTLQDP